MYGIPRFLTYRCLDLSNARCRDTVSSVGFIQRILPFTVSNTTIRFFRHAISLDERRARFQPNYCIRVSDSDQEGAKPGDIPWSFKRRPFYHRNRDDYNEHTKEGNNDRTDVREVWFAGCHCGMCIRLEPALSI